MKKIGQHDLIKFKEISKSVSCISTFQEGKYEKIDKNDEDAVKRLFYILNYDYFSNLNNSKKKSQNIEIEKLLQNEDPISSQRQAQQTGMGTFSCLTKPKLIHDISSVPVRFPEQGNSEGSILHSPITYSDLCVWFYNKGYQKVIIPNSYSS